MELADELARARDAAARERQQQTATILELTLTISKLEADKAELSKMLASCGVRGSLLVCEFGALLARTI